MKTKVRKAVAKNTRALMESQQVKQGDFRHRNGPSQKTLSNVLNENSDTSPTLDTIAQIARVLKIETWQMLVTDLDQHLRFHRQLRELVENYLQSTSEGKLHIQTVAERERQYARLNERAAAEASPSYSGEDDGCSCSKGRVI